jgi:hypothetical protein
VLNCSTAIALATRRLEEAKKRLIRQDFSITQIQQRGQDTSLAKEALGIASSILELMRTHRHLMEVLSRLARRQH